MKSYLIVYQDCANECKWVVLTANEDTLETVLEEVISTLEWNGRGQYYVVERTKE